MLGPTGLNKNGGGKRASIWAQFCVYRKVPSYKGRQQRKSQCNSVIVGLLLSTTEHLGLQGEKNCLDTFLLTLLRSVYTIVICSTQYSLLVLMHEIETPSPRKF